VVVEIVDPAVVAIATPVTVEMASAMTSSKR